MDKASVGARVGMGAVGVVSLLHGWQSGGGAALGQQIRLLLNSNNNGAAEQPPNGSHAKRTLSKLVRGALAIFLMRRGELAIGQRVAPFPGGLAALIALTFGLEVADRIPLGVNKSLASAVTEFSQPGLNFLGWWMPLFFSPPLAILPLALEKMLKKSGPAPAIKMLLILIGGFLATLLTTAAVAKAAGPPAIDNGDGGGDGSAPRTGGDNALGQDRRRRPGSAADPAVQVKKVILGGVVAILAALKLRGCDQLLLGSFSALAFAIGSSFPKKLKSSLHPVITCGVLTCLASATLNAKNGARWREALMAFSSGAGQFFLKFLGPALIAFAFRLLKTKRLLFSNLPQLAVGSIWATVFSLYGTALAARIINVEKGIALSLIPRAITTPLAVAMSKMLQSDASLTVVGVVISGILGANFGAPILSSLGFRGPLTRGISIGAAAHGLGVASLAESEPEASSAAAVSLILTGSLSTILVGIPFSRRVLLRVLGGPR
mmetsp:Transcript_54918/g.134629  ORF Transcript_54918/g.134629 Transcript_54918/m.134629 type:complete len:492 (-) Transcript_54918:97-1572(-)